MRLLRKGRGSNQYVSRPGQGAPPPRRESSDTAVAANQEPDTEDVAWQFHPDHHTWAAHGFASWKQAAPWIEQGTDPETASVWAAENVTAGMAPEWDELNVDPVSAGGFTGIGLDPRTARPWVDENISGLEAARWIESGFANPEEVVPWRRHFRTRNGPSDAAEWRQRGWDKPVLTTPWTERSFSAQEATDWRDHGYPDAREAEQWRNVGCDAALAARWWNESGCLPQEALTRIQAGVQPGQTYAEAGLIPPMQVQAD